MIENCIGKKRWVKLIYVFQQSIWLCLTCYSRKKASQLKSSSEKVNSFTSDSAGLGKLYVVAALLNPSFVSLHLGRNNH